MSGDIALLFKDKSVSEKKAAATLICKLIKDGKINGENFSIRRVANAVLGREAMERAGESSNDEEIGMVLKDASDPVNLQMFSNITNTLVYQSVIESFKSPDFIGDQLFRAETRGNDDLQRKTGLAPIDDDALVVQEAGEYPDVKFSEDYQDLPTTQKRGMKISVTREMLFYDKTGKVIEMAQGVGNRLGLNREKRMLRVFLGIVNNYNRKGVARNTYVASADPRINKVANPMTDWSDIDDALQLFTAMTDDRSVAEPIMVNPNTLVISPFGVMKTDRILNATEVRTTTNTNTQTNGVNPVARIKFEHVISSPWLDWLLVNEGGVSAANAKLYWHIGQPKKAFTYATVWPLAVRTAPPNDIDDFERDIVLKFRADERGVAYSESPWHMIQNTN